MKGSSRAADRGLRLSLFAVILIALLASIYLLGWPIVTGDTDLWYHLSGARFLLENHRLADHSYFSFLEPARPFVNYYWLFQVLVASFFKIGGYTALIVLRTLCFLVSFGLVAWMLFRTGRARHPEPSLALLCGLYASILLTRGAAVRPHLITYMMIPAFLAILHVSPQRAKWLIPLGILWMNLHGIAYPVMVGILGVYLIDAGIRLASPRRPLSPEERGALAPVGLTLLTPLLTPHAFRLLAVPWRSIEDSATYINELVRIDPMRLMSWNISEGVPAVETLQNLLFVFTVLAVVRALLDRPPGLRAFCWFALGMFLLTKGTRFITEWSLLSVPLLAGYGWGPLRPPAHPKRLQLRRNTAIALGVGMGLTLIAIPDIFIRASRPRYPLCPARLPQGVTTFLKHVDTGGRVANHPNSGGFFHWELYPRYLIQMDMQLPFLFSDADYFTAGNMLASPEVLKRHMAQYRPEYIAVPLAQFKYFKKDVLKHVPGWKLVFFDEEEALFVYEPLLPAIAARYGLSALDPDELYENAVEMEKLLTADKIVPMVQEARRMLEIFPGGVLTNLVAATALRMDHAYDRMLPHAEMIADRRPEFPTGWSLLGDAHFGLGHFREAARAYDAALAPGRKASNARHLGTRLGMSELGAGNYPKAYKQLAISVELYHQGAAFDALYARAEAAKRTGRWEEAAYVSRLAWAKYPSDPVQRERQIFTLLRIGIVPEPLEPEEPRP